MNRVNFECQREIVDEGLNSQYVNNEEHKLQTEEKYEIVNMRKALYHYKNQNSHFNSFNDQLVQYNHILR